PEASVDRWHRVGRRRRLIWRTGHVLANSPGSHQPAAPTRSQPTNPPLRVPRARADNYSQNAYPNMLYVSVFNFRIGRASTHYHPIESSSKCELRHTSRAILELDGPSGSGPLGNWRFHKRGS